MRLVWVAGALGVVLVLVAAKAHGRQVRLEREREGHHEVVFGGENHPYVEALWRADRWRFWISTPLFAAALGGVAWWFTRTLGPALVATLALAPALGFALAGLLSARRLWLRGPPRAWGRGSAAWWSAAGAVWAATALAAWF